MTGGLTTLLLVGLFWNVLLLMTLLFCVFRRRRMALHNARLSQPHALLSAVLIRPCAGDEPGLEACLTSIVHARRSFPVEVVFGVDSPKDTAIPAIQAAVAALRDHDIPSRMVVAPIIGPNRKVSILAGCMDTVAREVEIVISADSNTDLSGYNLDSLARSRAAAMWAPPRVDTPSGSGWGSRMQQAVLLHSWHSFGLLSALDPRGMVGKLFALKREALDRIGGFGALVNYLGEDMQLSRLLREHGYDVTSDIRSVRTVVPPASPSATLARFARWTMVIKAQRRALLVSYPLLFFHFVPTLLLGLFAIPILPILALILLLLGGVVRWSVGVTASRMLGIRPRLLETLTMPAVADVVLCAAFFKALTMKQVEWRGRAFTLGPSGELSYGRQNTNILGWDGHASSEGRGYQ